MSANNDQDRLKEMARRWEREYYSSIGKTPERKQRFENLSWTKIRPLYTPADLEGFDYERDLSFPGKYPYTRGVYTTRSGGDKGMCRERAGC